MNGSNPHGTGQAIGIAGAVQAEYEQHGIKRLGAGLAGEMGAKLADSGHPDDLARGIHIAAGVLRASRLEPSPSAS